MKRVLLLIPLLLFVAAITAPQDASIEAEYGVPDQEVFYESSGLLRGTQTYAEPTIEISDGALTITRQVLGLSSTSNIFIIQATDVRDNPSIHDITVIGEPEVEITLTAPSVGGFAESPNYEFAVQTSSQAICYYQWGPSAPSAPLIRMQTIVEPGDLPLHIAENFSTIHRFHPEEAVPIRVVCQLAGETSMYTALIGFTESPQNFEAEAFPTRITGPATRFRVWQQSKLPTTCELTSTQATDVQRPYALQAKFDTAAAQTLYRLDCQGARGQTLQSRTFTATQLQGRAPSIIIDTPELLNNPSAILSAYTSSQSTCFYTVTARGGASVNEPEVEMGAFISKTHHQRPITLAEGENTVQVRCEDADLPSLESTTQKTLFVDNTAPTASISQAELCTINEGELVFDRAIITVSAPGAHYLEIEGAEGVVVQRQYLPTDDAMQLAQAGLGVADGDTIQITPIDRAGNRGSVASASIATSENPLCEFLGFPMHIELISPTNGIAGGDEWDLEITTEREASCVATPVDGESVDMEATGQTHTITNYSDYYTENERKNTTIVCTEENGLVTTKEYDLRWFIAPPSIISATASPNPVTNISNPYSTITIVTDQPTVCSVDDTFPEEYSTTHEIPVAIQYGSGSTDFLVRCNNGIPMWNETTVTIEEDYPVTLTITLVSPTVTNNTRYNLRVITDAGATCRRGSTTLTADGLSHSGQITLTQGSNDVLVSCTDLEDDTKVKQETFEIIADTRGPTVTLNNTAMTCGLDEYLVRASIEDETDLSEVAVTFANRTYRFSEPSKDFAQRLRNLDLEAGEAYSLEVVATDAVGNTGRATAQVRGEEEDAGACDTEGPTVWISQRILNTGTEAELRCQDNVACADAYRMGTASPGGECEMQSYSFSSQEAIFVTENTKICYEVEDVNGNPKTGSKVIYISQRPDHCYDEEKSGDESDVDCGGSCAPCGTCALACNTDNDCGSGQTCIDNLCSLIATCNTDGDCPSSQRCQEGVCATASKAVDVCQDDRECGTGEICSGGSCWKPEARSCTSTANCPRGMFCEGNVCVQDDPECEQSCNSDDDCATDACTPDNTCGTQDDACSNGELNEGETDVDCGGVNCLKCEAGKVCEFALDCASRNCLDGTCAEATCDDSIRNGDETDVDCGGPTCAKCNKGQTCKISTDCVSGICNYGVCDDEELQNPTGDNDNFTPPSDSGFPLFAVILIVLGVLLSMGGGGYIYYEKQHDGKQQPSMPSTGAPTTPTTSRPKPTTPGLDLSKSRLREEARSKRREKRAAKRSDLMSSFEKTTDVVHDEDHKETTIKEHAGDKKEAPDAPRPKKDHNHPRSEDVHKKLATAKDKDALVDLAKSLMESDDVEKHHIESALTDLEAEGKVSKTDGKSVREILEMNDE